jgi:hypothetical protein
LIGFSGFKSSELLESSVGGNKDVSRVFVGATVVCGPTFSSAIGGGSTTEFSALVKGWDSIGGTVFSSNEESVSTTVSVLDAVPASERPHAVQNFFPAAISASHLLQGWLVSAGTSRSVVFVSAGGTVTAGGGSMVTAVGTIGASVICAAGVTATVAAAGFIISLSE